MNGAAGSPTTLYFSYDGHGSVLRPYERGRCNRRLWPEYANSLTTTPTAIRSVSTLRRRRRRSYTAGSKPTQPPVCSTCALGCITQARERLQASIRAAGNQASPVSYNTYLYTQADPINGYDPSGHDLADVLATLGNISNLISTYVPAPLLLAAKWGVIGGTATALDRLFGGASAGQVAWGFVQGFSFGFLAGLAIPLAGAEVALAFGGVLTGITCESRNSIVPGRSLPTSRLPRRLGDIAWGWCVSGTWSGSRRRH